MDEERSAEPCADGAPIPAPFRDESSAPLQRLNGVERYGQRSRGAFPWRARLEESEVEIDISNAHQLPRQWLPGGRDEGNDVTGAELAPQLVERGHRRLSHAG